ncbi:MAG: hypothetical protein AB7L09_01825 [Nitrospira sp.]
MATTTPTTMTELEYAICEYSDLYKELRGFRPRHAFATLADASAALAVLYAEQAAEGQRREAERGAFRVKLAALGLNPDKYMHLA